MKGEYAYAVACCFITLIVLGIGLFTLIYAFGQR